MKQYSEIQKQSEAYEVIFTVENKLRVAMHNVMVEKEGVNYFSQAVLPPFKHPTISKQKVDVTSRARDRKSYEKSYNLKLKYDYHYFWYLDFRVLVATLEAFWNCHFCSIFKDAGQIKDEIIDRLMRSAAIRNAIAHNRYISNIDLSDLISLRDLVDAYLDQRYLNNFKDLALNTYERTIRQAVALLASVKQFVQCGKYVPRQMLEELESAFSAYNAITESEELNRQFQGIPDLIRQYNKLPRKPGTAERIEAFVHESGLERKVVLLAKHMGG